MAPIDQDALVREDAARAGAPFRYVGDMGRWVQLSGGGATAAGGPWTAPARARMCRALAVLDATPELPRWVHGHWCAMSAQAVEAQLLVVEGTEGLEVVRAEAPVTWDDVAGVRIPGTPRTLTRTHHGDDVMLLAEHFARMRCALGHITGTAP